MFSRNKYYVRLFINRVDIKDLTNGKSISEKSEMEFNNQRLLLANLQIAENFVKSAFEKNGFSSRNSIAIIQQMQMSEGGLSEVERLVLKELFSIVGIKEIRIDESLSNLTEKQLVDLIQ